MNQRDLRPLGAALLAVGAVALLMRSGIFGLLPAFVWVVALFVAGGVFWRRSAGRMAQWQRVLGFAAIGLLATITSGPLGGVAAMGFVGMAFWTSYLHRPQTWSLVPAGIFSSLAAVALVETLFGIDGGALFVLGMAATFSSVYLLPRERGGASWALVPAIVFIVLTVAVNDPHGDGPPFLLPLLLIGSGVGVLLWWRRSR